MKKNIVLLIMMVIFITACNKEQIMEEKEVNPIINVEYKEDKEIEFLSKVKVSDFINNINGTIKDYEIDTSEIGIRKVEYEYINDDGINVKQDFEINIVDKKAPIIWVSGTYTLTKGENIDVARKIMCADDYDDNPDCKVEGEYDTNKVGSYSLTYIASDSSGNKTSKKFTLKVVNPSNNNSGGGTTTKTNYSDVVSKYKNSNTEIGLDISKWQGDIDFDKLKAAGVEFVFIRVGVAAGSRKRK